MVFDDFGSLLGLGFLSGSLFDGLFSLFGSFSGLRWVDFGVSGGRFGSNLAAKLPPRMARLGSFGGQIGSQI